MSSSVETRILEMQLDNDQFEKGIKSTIASLEELEDKLELKNVENGFDKISSAANTMQFNHMENSLDSITDKFTLLGNVGLQALERISNKIVDLGENIIKGITLDPLTDGWKEFEMKTTSTQTIFGGIKDNYKSEAAAFDAIGKSLDNLNEYADKTIYNFAQMTENVGKFTNQNIGLETSVKAMKGIGNWAAMVGADSAQMSRAMYNISQSLGSGAMKLIDWKSIRLANMATPNVQKLFADVAKSKGSLKDSKGNAVKKGSKQETTEYNNIISDFESSLKNGWLTNDVMMSAFKILSNEMTDEDWSSLFGDSEEAQEMINKYKKMGEYAAEAATKVKTFSQLMDTLKESLGSGWATTFEKLFGGFEKQTEFLTKIKDILDEVIGESNTGRNNWVDQFANSQGIEKAMSTIEQMVRLFSDLWHLVMDIGDKLADPFDGAFYGAFFGNENLQELGLTAVNISQFFADIETVITKFREWLNRDHIFPQTFTKQLESFEGELETIHSVLGLDSMAKEIRYESKAVDESVTTPYDNIIKIFAGIGSVVMIAMDALQEFSKFVLKVAALFAPLVASVLDLFGGIGDVLFYLYANIAGQHSLAIFFENLYTAIEPVVKAIVGLAKVVVDFIKTTLGLDEDLGNLTDGTNKFGLGVLILSKLFTSIPKLIQGALEGITNFTESLTRGFKAIKRRVKKDGITPFENLKDSVVSFFTAGFGGDVGQTVKEWIDNNITGSLKDMVEWMANSWDSIETFFTELPEKFNKLVEKLKAGFQAFNSYHYDDSLDGLTNFKNQLQLLLTTLFDEETGKELIKMYEEHVEPAIRTIAGMIESAFGEITRVLNGVLKVFNGDYSGINDPFAFLQQIALNFFEGYNKNNTDEKAVEQGRLGILEFFKNLSDTYEKDVEPYVKKLTGWFTNDIPKAFETIRTALFGYDTADEGAGGISGDQVTNGAVAEHVGGIFERIWNWTQSDGPTLVNNILGFFRDAWSKINAFLFGYDIADEGAGGISGDQVTNGAVAGHVDGFVDKINHVWESLEGVYLNFSTWVGGEGDTAKKAIIDFLFGEVDEASGERIGGFIGDVQTWYNNNRESIIELFTVNIPKLFTDIKNALLGYDTGNYVKTGENEFGPIYEPEHITGIFEPILNYIRSGEAEETLAEISGFFEGLWNSITGILYGTDSAHNEKSTYARKHKDGLFDTVGKWLDTDGAKLWSRVDNFINGSDVLDENGNVIEHKTGVFEAVKTFLDPIYDWITEKGEKVYEYLTTKNFSEMWADLDEFLFGAKDLKDASGNTRISDGVLTPIMNVLEPIANFFARIGTTAFDYLSKIDYAKVWQKIDEFFGGYDKYVTVNPLTGEFKTEHVDGMLDKLGNIINRVDAFFESETWAGIKQSVSDFYNNCIVPIETFMSGIGSTLLTSLSDWHTDESVFDNVLRIFSDITTYGNTELPNLVSTILSGLNLNPDTLLSGAPEFIKKILGGKEDAGEVVAEQIRENTKQEKTTKETSAIDVMKWLGLTAAADEFEQIGNAEAQAEQTVTNSINENLKKNGLSDMWDKNREALSNIFNTLMDSVLGFFQGLTGNLESLGTLLIGGIAISKTSDIVNALTGTEKDSFIQDLADMFNALGGLISDIALLIAAVTAADLVDSLSAESVDKDAQNLENTGDKAEKRLSSVERALNVIERIFNMFSSAIVKFGLGSFVTETVATVATDITEDAFKLNYSNDVTSISENIKAFGVGLKSIAESISILMEDMLKIVGLDFLLELLPDSLFTDADEANNKREQVTNELEQRTDHILNGTTLSESGDRLEILFDKIGYFMTKFSDIVTSIMSNTTTQSLIYGTSTSWLSGIIFRGTSSTGGGNGLRTRVDSYANGLMAVGTFMESMASAIGTVLTTLTFTSLFTNYQELDSKLAVVEHVVDIFKKVLNAVSLVIALITGKEIANSLRGLDINSVAGALSVKTGGTEVVSGAITRLKNIATTVTWVGAFLAMLVLISDLALVVLNKNIQTAGTVIFTAVTQIKSALDAISSIDLVKSVTAKAALLAAKDALTILSENWTFTSEFMKNNSEDLKYALINIGQGFTSASSGTSEFDSDKFVKIFKDLNEAWNSLYSKENGSGFDIVDFQAKMSVLQIAGENIEATAASFRSVTSDDVTNMSIVKDYLEKYKELAEILAAIGSLGNFTAAVTWGFDVAPFIDFIGQLEKISDEGDVEDVRQAFELLIEALPDSPELLAKLQGFTDAGGGNLGLFVSGLTGLNKALIQYADVMSSIGTSNFTEQANALAIIDGLGKATSSVAESTENSNIDVANTRLRVFANDLSILADSFGKMMQASVKTDGSNYDFGQIASFLERVRYIGIVFNNVGYDSGIPYFLDQFVADFEALSNAMVTFGSALNPQTGLDASKLDPLANFMERIVGFEERLNTARLAKINNGAIISKIGTKLMDTGTDLSLLTSVLPPLGVAINDFYIKVKDNFTGEEADKAFGTINNAANFVRRMSLAAASMKEVSTGGYTLKNLTEDLYNTSGTGLFNMLPTMFNFLASGGSINEEGLQRAESIFGFFGLFAGRLANLLNAASVSDYASVGAPIQEIINLFGTDLYPTLTSMPLTELQGYAAAFKDLSDAMTLDNRTATLANAIDEAIEKLKDKEVQVVVTPIWKWDSEIPTELNPENPLTNNPNMDSTYANNISYHIQFPDRITVKMANEDLSSITSTITNNGQSTRAEISSAASSVSGMQVVLDTGALVGHLTNKINKALGKNFTKGTTRTAYNPTTITPTAHYTPLND